MESAKISEVKKPGRRSTRVKNLEEEVELIFSQDENNDENSVADRDKNEIFPTTPRTKKITEQVVTPKASQTVLEEILQTPRRSCRKSIKPTQEYEDIVNKSLRLTRSVRKQLSVTEEEKENECLEPEIEVPKWTPAEVGRVSQKRGRKSKRGTKGKKQDETETTQLLEETIFGSECGETKETTETLENEHVVEKMSEQIDIDQNENDTNKQMQFNDNIVDIKENPEPAAAGILVEDRNRTFANKEHFVEKVAEQNDIDQNENNTTKQMKLDDNIVEENPGVVVEDLNRTFKNKTEHQNYNENKDDQEIDTDEIDSDTKDVNDSIHLSQEDSEDCHKFTEKSEQEEICIIYESNISNREINEIHSPSPKRSVQGKKDSFGSYLKSKQINMSDLGLNPLKDEGEEKESYSPKSALDEAEEMPSLIIFDDEAQNTESNKLNDTFDADEMCPKDNEVDMEVLQLSDDDVETPKKRVRIVVTGTPKGSTSKVKLPSTPKPLATPKLSVKPNQSKPFRFPTPFRREKPSFKFDEVEENIKNTSKNTSKASSLFVTTLEPREIVLRGIRKRSLSVCIQADDKNCDKQQARMVSFYSPANETAIIDDIDKLIASSVKKPDPKQKASDKFVTTRRKRSISLDESLMSTALASKLPRPMPGQNIASKAQSSSSTSKTQIRTKLPNFAAIHEKQFKRMENLVEHVNRKQERSKNLINSATKLKQVSARKNASVVKSSDKILTAKSKALKKINMSQIKPLNTTTTPRQLPEIKVARELPDPRLGATKLVKSASISRKSPHHQQQNNKYLKPSQTSNIEKPQSNSKTLAPPKPTFNLSTSLMVNKPPMVSSSHMLEKPNVSHMSHDDKMASRLQRHMDLFKGRTAPSSRTGAASKKNEVILKGVRSNRRFELQMKHRKNLEQ